MVKEYMENPDKDYELEYPEFADYRQYLTIQEMNSLRWNKDKMVKQVKDKKLLNEIFKEVFIDGFVSRKELKQRFKDAFAKYGITLTAKATLIEKCTIYNVNKCDKKVNGKTVSGYELRETKYKP